MGKFEKLYRKIISGKNPDISFGDLQYFIEHLGPRRKRVRGSHYVYTFWGVERSISIQAEGNMAKEYQIKQVRKLLKELKSGGNHDEEQ